MQRKDGHKIVKFPKGMNPDFVEALVRLWNNDD